MTASSVTGRRILAGAVVAALLSGPATAATSGKRIGYSNAGGRAAPPPRPPADKGGADVAAIAAAAAAVTLAAIIVGRHAAHHEESVGDNDLLTNGPQLDLTQQQGSIAVHGFVQSNWPLVIDFASRPGSQTYASISIKGRRPVLIPLDLSGAGGRHTLNDVRIPEQVGAQRAQPGVIIVYSVFASASTSNANGRSGPAYAPLDIFGIGAGPSAVGSVAIENLQFSQKQHKPGQGFAAYGYLAESAFNRIAPEILRFIASGNTISVASIRQLDSGPPRAGPYGAGWDGLNGQGLKQAGVTRLQVRGWMTDVNDRSWVGAVSPQSIVIK